MWPLINFIIVLKKIFRKTDARNAVRSETRASSASSSGTEDAVREKCFIFLSKASISLLQTDARNAYL